MNKSKRMVAGLTIALLITLGMVNLHCLTQSASQKSAVQQSMVNGEVLDLKIRINLLPCMQLNIVFDNR